MASGFLLDFVLDEVRRAFDAKTTMDPQFERRKRVRHKAVGTAHLRVLNPRLEGAIEVEAIDQSDEGLAFRSPWPLAPGTTVQLRFQDQLLMGEVRHCLEESERRFRIGIRVDETMPYR